MPTLRDSLHQSASPIIDEHLWTPLEDQLASSLARFRPKIDHPIDHADDLEIVLDDHHRIALVDESIQQIHQLIDIIEVQAGCRFVEHKECFPRRWTDQFGSQFDSLRFASR